MIAKYKEDDSQIGETTIYSQTMDLKPAIRIQNT